MPTASSDGDEETACDDRCIWKVYAHACIYTHVCMVVCIHAHNYFVVGQQRLHARQLCCLKHRSNDLILRNALVQTAMHSTAANTCLQKVACATRTQATNSLQTSANEFRDTLQRKTTATHDTYMILQTMQPCAEKTYVADIRHTYALTSSWTHLRSKQTLIALGTRTVQHLSLLYTACIQSSRASK